MMSCMCWSCRGPEWCRENKVELIFGRATKIDRSKKCVEVECKGEVKQVSYEELVIATGSKAWLPPVPGLSLEALRSLRMSL